VRKLAHASEIRIKGESERERNRARLGKFPVSEFRFGNGSGRLARKVIFTAERMEGLFIHKLRVLRVAVVNTRISSQP